MIEMSRPSQFGKCGTFPAASIETFTAGGSDGTDLWDVKLKVARNNSTVGCRSDDAERALE